MVEMAFVIFFLAFISVAFYTYITLATNAWIMVTGRSSLSSSAAVAMNRIVSDIRDINAPSSLLNMQPANCRFRTIAGDDITYSQVGNNLMQTVNTNNNVMLSNLSANGLLFTYLKRGSMVTTEAVDVRSVRIKISITKGTQIYNLESAARIRNIMP